MQTGKWQNVICDTDTVTEADYWENEHIEILASSQYAISQKFFVVIATRSWNSTCPSITLAYFWTIFFTLFSLLLSLQVEADGEGRQIPSQSVRVQGRAGKASGNVIWDHPTCGFSLYVGGDSVKKIHSKNVSGLSTTRDIVKTMLSEFQGQVVVMCL